MTASHNPGGPENDFGIKYNCSNGGPAPDALTNKIYEISTKIETYRIVPEISIELDKVGSQTFQIEGDTQFTVNVIDSIVEYRQYMQEIFDFEKLEKFINGKKTTDGKPLKILIDSMNGVTGPYVEEIFLNCFGCSKSSIIHTKPLPDFGGLHPDPNLTYAKDLVQEVTEGDYDLGAAFDGDGVSILIIFLR